MVAGAHQVLCITHLPQIAAMADKHFLINKVTDSTTTLTQIEELKEEEQLKELARLLGGEDVTEAALANAKEMRKQALEIKGK